MVLLLVAGVVSARFAAAGAGPGPRAGFLAAIVGLYGVLLFGLATNVGYVSSRHVLPPLVPLLAYAGLGVLALADRAAGRVSPERAPRRRRAVLAALVGVVAALGLGKALSRLDQRGEVAERRAAEWVRESGGPGTVVAARKRRVGYFDDHAVRFVIVNQSDVPEYVGLAPLVGAALHEVQRVEAEGETAVVYAYGAPPAAAAGGP
jgi:hypothetical protein